MAAEKDLSNAQALTKAEASIDAGAAKVTLFVQPNNKWTFMPDNDAFEHTDKRTGMSKAGAKDFIRERLVTANRIQVAKEPSGDTYLGRVENPE